MRDFNTVTNELIRKLLLSVEKEDGEILWYYGTLEVLVEFLSIIQQKYAHIPVNADDVRPADMR